MASLASWGLGWRDRLARGSSGVGPQPAEHQEYIHQSNEPELVEKEGWYHGNAPQRMVEEGHFNGVFALSELSAGYAYTTGVPCGNRTTMIRSQTTVELDWCQLFFSGHKLQGRAAHERAMLAS
jgi:hypothetical protein